MQSVGIMCSAVCALSLACAPAASDGPHAQSPERQSQAQYDLAREYFYKGHPREALDHVLAADKLDDTNSKALYFTSAIYLEFCSGDRGLGAPDCELSSAEKYARKALEHDEHFRDARNLLGNILILEEKYAEAITLLEPLVKDPSYNAPHLAWGNLGWAQVKEGHLDEGIASLRNAVTQPKFCVGFYRLGVAYEKKGDLASAEQNFSTALKVDSPDCQNLQDAWHERGEVRLKLGRVEEACSDFSKCRDLSVATDAGKACAAAMTKCPVGKPGAAAGRNADETRRTT
ncbi:MAG TPA: tetratricopeptide repeat protein [Polyangiaceae bacterium]|jgi:Tfp pilus assembly protein PilF